MSPHWRWWVQPSEISTVSPSFSRRSAAAPSTAVRRSPLYRAKRMENEVRRTESGTIRLTMPKACESVTTSAGGSRSRLSVRASSVSRVTTGIQPASSSERMVCCCGRIRRPLGAAESIGVTRTTASPGDTRSAMSSRAGGTECTRAAIFSLSAWMFPFSRAETKIIFSGMFSGTVIRSALFIAIT